MRRRKRGYKDVHDRYEMIKGKISWPYYLLIIFSGSVLLMVIVP